MHQLDLPDSAISVVMDDPTILSNVTAYSSLGISPESASYVLNRGYTVGFRDLFFLNAALSVLATIVTILMIKHKELLRGDEEELRKKALSEVMKEKDSTQTPMSEQINGVP